MKKNILFVGENPLTNTGNAHMMRSLLSVIDEEKYRIACFGAIEVPPWQIDIFQPLTFTNIPAREGHDVWGQNKLCETIERSNNIDALVMVGVDIWRYSFTMERLAQLQKSKGFRWIWFFPYDLHMLRKDYVKWINKVSYPCVYSHYGFDMLKDHCPTIRYFRPPLDGASYFKRYTDVDRQHMRRLNFPMINQDTFLFGFVGANQIRKDPTKLLQAFRILKNSTDRKAVLYLHTELRGGIYNLMQYMTDLKMTTGDIIIKHQGGSYKTEKMVNVYNCFDALVNCSMQEGLAWTVVEALICGVPVIATKNTAHVELLHDVGFLIPCEQPSLIPMFTGQGEGWVDSKACKAEDLASAMLGMMELEPNRMETMKRLAWARGKEWLEGVHDFNELLEEVFNEEIRVVSNIEEGVLFAQHSAAGDVFMTTRCLKGIKERHNLPIYYMTSPQYMDIIKGNPYVKEILPWDESMLNRFRIRYNPHGDRILPGHWGRNCNSILSDFYWKLLEVEPDGFFIERERPELPTTTLIENEPRLFVVQTTGGDPQFRTYKYMADVCEWLKKEGYTTVQLGGPDDFPANADIDMRGLLSYRASAWVMDHAVGAVTIDSFISHLAGAIGVSQVCLFGSGNAVVTRPNQLKGYLVCLSPDYVRDCPGLGPCSAAIRDCPAPCTGSHDPKRIIREIKFLRDSDWLRRTNEHKTAGYLLKHAE